MKKPVSQKADSGQHAALIMYYCCDCERWGSFEVHDFVMNCVLTLT